MARPSQPTSTELEDALTFGGRPLKSWLWVAVFSALALVLALAAGLIWRQYEDAKREAAADLRSRAVLAATVFDTYFTGELAALKAIAASPAVVSKDREAMSRYFARFRPGQDTTFPAGVGWIDLTGRQRATSDPRGVSGLSLADRSYFQQAIKTEKPFVGEAIIARMTKRRLVVMSVPTRDRRGRLSGVLAGGIVLQPSDEDSRATELGYEGLEILDRKDQRLSRRDLAAPTNSELVSRIAGTEGVLVDTHGLDGSEGRVVAYAYSKVPGWTAVLDQSTSTVFAGARRSLVLESVLLAGAAVLMLALISWALLRTRRSLRAGSVRVSRWADLTRALNEAADIRSVADVLARALAIEFPRTTAVVAVSDAHRASQLEIARRKGANSGVTSVDAAGADDVAENLMTESGMVALQTGTEIARRLAAAHVPARARSLYAAPLVEQDGDIVGVAVLLSASERALGSDGQGLLRALADQSSQGLARIRRHQHEHDVAVLLQESLLPDELPTGEGLAVSAHYRAGVTDTNVGGDWYDAVRRPDAIVHLTVGDVAGRGIEAAVAMGQLRHAFRAYALEHRSPSAIIERVARHVPSDGMATMVCAAYDPLTGSLAYASAGHPPPLLIDRTTKSITRLEADGAGPLGWRQTSGADDEHIALSKSTLALYTDGLVERRSLPLDEGIARLGQAILEAISAEQHDPASRVVDRMIGSGRPDDVAVLLADLDPAPSRVALEIDSDPKLLGDLRRRVRSWLDARGVSSSEREGTVLALSEACNNAIEHAYRDAPGPIRIELEHVGSSIQIRVSDTGSWREPVEDSTRGRGLLLMTGLMDEAEIIRTSTGTQVVLEHTLRG